MPAARTKTLTIKLDTYTDLSDHDLMALFYQAIDRLGVGWSELHVKVDLTPAAEVVEPDWPEGEPEFG